MSDNHCNCPRFFPGSRIHHLKTPFEQIFLYRHRPIEAMGGYPAKSGLYCFSADILAIIIRKDEFLECPPPPKTIPSLNCGSRLRSVIMNDPSNSIVMDLGLSPLPFGIMVGGERSCLRWARPRWSFLIKFRQRR